MPERPRSHARVHAWGKINLGLRILAREENGYHQLETIFQRISLADLVEVHIDDGDDAISIACSPPIDVADEENLAWRAAALYRKQANWPAPGLGITIRIDKQIPTGGGLGGGSADAGAVLRALNALNPVPLAAPVLFTIASQLGADVPFLATDLPRVLAWGRGERMLGLPPLPQRPVALALFETGVHTAEAYRGLAAARTNGLLLPHGSAVLSDALAANWCALADLARNDFEQPVFAVRHDIAQLHAQWSAALPDAMVRMSGSGATVFAVPLDATADLAPVAPLPLRAGIRQQHAVTLDAVPPVVILSLPSGSR